VIVSHFDPYHGLIQKEIIFKTEITISNYLSQIVQNICFYQQAAYYLKTS
jgi:hypothetical protein